MNKKKYPPDWDIRRERILTRAGQVRQSESVIKVEATCERCGKVQNHDVGYWDENDNWHSIEKSHLGDALAEDAENDGYKIIMIVLTIMHLDHDEENWNVKDERLAAACQRCHLRYDAPEKARRRLEKRESQMMFSIEAQGVKQPTEQPVTEAIERIVLKRDWQIVQELQKHYSFENHNVMMNFISNECVILEDGDERIFVAKNKPLFRWSEQIECTYNGEILKIIQK